MVSHSTSPKLTLPRATSGLVVPGKSERRWGTLPGRLGLFYLVMCVLAFAVYSWPVLRSNTPSGLRMSESGWGAAPLIQKDSASYLEVAQDISDLSLDKLHIRTLGYPAFLAATGTIETPSRALYFVSLILHLASVWLLAVVLHGCGVHRHLVVAFGLVMVLPPLVEPAAFVMTENLSQFMIILGMSGITLGLARRQTGWLIAGGVGLAYAGLVHPLYQALSLMVLLCLVFMKVALPWAQLSMPRLMKSAGIIFGVWVLIIGGMMVKNKVTFDYVGLTPFTGFAISTKTVRVVEQLPDEYRAAREVLVAARDADLVKSGSSHSALSYIWRAHPELSRVTGLEGAALSGYLVKLNLVLIRQAPMSYLEDVVATIAGFWTPSAGQGLASLDSRILSLAWAGLDLAFIAGFFLLFVIVAGATALARVGRLIANRELSWPGPSYVRMRTVGYTLALGLVFYATMICGVAGPGLTRYRTPVMPLVIFAVFVGLDVCWRLRRRTR